LILCLESILLMRLKVFPKEVKKATDIRSSLSVASLSSGLRARRNCL
jgi:hypothetical protein